LHHTTEFYKVFITYYILKTETEIDINVKKQQINLEKCVLIKLLIILQVQET